ncbi:MAG: HAMP domain-containing histidine kinase [Chitinophagaceae bacterium]|nr:MAG: HAMP domain-containing histidine kinase [Chitinophagaceae bacterium]
MNAIRIRGACLITVMICLCSPACRNEPVPTMPNHAAGAFDQLVDTAQMHQYQGHSRQAIRYHKRALAFARANGLYPQQAMALLRIANLLPPGDADSSLRCLGHALDISRTLNNAELQADIYRSLAGVHKQQQDYTSAMVALQAHHRITDSLLNGRRIKDIRQLEVQRKTDRKSVISLAVSIGLLAVTLTFVVFLIRTRRLNRKLEQTVVLRNKLFSIIGHDLRGPAGSLRQALEMMDSGGVGTGEFPGLLKMLKDQSFMLSETLDNLLIWSRSQLNEIRPEPTEFSICGPIGSTLSLLQVQYRSKNIRVTTDVPEGVSVYADRDQFDFIIRNLVSNSIKFSFSGGTIELAARTRNGRTEISVTDHGIGIDVQMQHKFTSGNLKTTFGTAGEKGTGLGLHMVRDFIEAGGGKIGLTSGHGETCFRLSLPSRAPGRAKGIPEA